MLKVEGFCDLCVALNGNNTSSLKDTLSRLVTFGYKTVAINQTIDDTVFENKKKKKKGEVRESPDVVPLPISLDFADEFKGRLQILHRLTISYAEQTNIHKLSQSQNIKKYNIIAALPTTQQALQHACGGAFDFDIFSFNPENRTAIKFNRKLYNVLKDRGIYFEIMYSPAIKDSSTRKNIIHMSHLYHALGKSKNIILCSNASEAIHVRAPYDLVNLGLIFGLSEEQSKSAILSNCRKVVIRAEGRRHGKAVMLVKQVASKIMEESENDSSDVYEDDDMESDLLEPALKKTKI